MVPCIDQSTCRVRCVDQRVVVGGPHPGLHLAGLVDDGEHGVTEAIHLGQVLRLGRLDHEGACHREAHGRGVEAVVDETFGDVVHRDSRLVGEWTQVQDALVGDEVVAAGVEDRHGVAQPMGDVVGVEHGLPGGLAQSLQPHETDVGPRDGQYRCRTVGGCRDGQSVVGDRSTIGSGVLGAGHLPVAGQEGCQVGLGSNRADARPAATMGDGKGLVQVEVRDVTADLAGACHPEQGVEVGPVDVDLAAGLVHHLADLAHTRLVDAVGGGIGDHDRGELVTVLVDLGGKVVQIDVPAVVGGHDDDLHPGQRCRGGIGAVCRGGHQADVALAVAAGTVVATNGLQTSVLSLGTGIGLQTHRVVPGELGQPGLQLVDHLQRPFGVLGRDERVQTGELWPGDGLHLHGGVELEGARTQRDHATVQGEVAVGEPLEVAHHGRLGAEAREHRVGEVLGGAHQGPRPSRAGAVTRGGGGVVAGGWSTVRSTGQAGTAQQIGQGDDVVVGHGLVQRDAQCVVVNEVQGEPRFATTAPQLTGSCRHIDPDGVEKGCRGDGEAACSQGVGQSDRAPVHLGGDPTQPGWAMPDGVHAGHDGKQHLGGADVGGGTVASDVLLAGLQGQPIGRVAVRIDRGAHQTTGNLTFQAFAYGHETGARTTEPHRYPEPLRGTDGDISSQITRSTHHGQAQQVTLGHGNALGLPDGGEDLRGIPQLAGGIGVGSEHPEAAGLDGWLPLGTVTQVDGDDVDAQAGGAASHDLTHLIEDLAVDQETIRLVPAGSTGQQHCLGGGSGLVEQGGVRHRKGREVRDHLLEDDERLQASLGDLGLVGGVRGVPGWVLQDVATDHRRGDRAVIAASDESLGEVVARGHPT